MSSRADYEGSLGAAKQAVGQHTVKVTGGAEQAHYWTPDGREIWATPCWRHFVINETGRGGLRDANFDKGWLPNAPSLQDRKKFCGGCDRWHDTDEQVSACIASKRAVVEKAEREARAKLAEKQGNNGQVAGLDDLQRMVAAQGEQIAALTRLMTQMLTGGDNGPLLQSNTDAEELSAAEAADCPG